MSARTSNYDLYTLSLGDIWYPLLDQQNMLTIENQVKGAMLYLGPGVLSGWDVTKMVSTGGLDPNLDYAIATEQAALIAAYNANQDSTLGIVYQQIGLPVTDADWAQVIRVTAGSGNVGVYPASTVSTFYFRYSQAGVYYVWAEAGQCLVTDARAVISAPLDGNYNYDEVTLATYLATVNVADVNSVVYVDTIIYEDRREDLFDLYGQFLAAMRAAFYHHVHSGQPGSPSKINLSTLVALTGSGPTGSTIFELLDSNGKLFTWTASNYGIPIVRVGNVVLPAASYNLSPSSGKIYLVNSLVAGTPINVFLPLSPQVSLTLRSPSAITDAKLYLTDGVSAGTDSDGNPLGPRLFTWDPAVYREPDVYLKGNLIDPSLYTAYPDQGAITFTAALTSPPYVGADLLVIVSKVGDQITGKLSGKRLSNVNASTFTYGQLDGTRIVGLDHVGMVRLREVCNLNPSLRLFAFGDRSMFAPEIVGSPMQYATDVYAYHNSANIPTPSILTGTKRGLMVQSNGTDATLQTGWTTDLGRPVKFYDELFPPTGENHYATTVLVTDEGQVWVTRSQGVGWSQFKQPVVVNAIPATTCFHTWTKRVEDFSHIILAYIWSQIYYIGTVDGLFTGEQADNTTDEDWDWSVVSYTTGSTVYDVFEMVTIHQTTDDQGTTEGLDRTLYVTCDAGFFVGGTKISSMVPKGLLWLKNGNSVNDLLWWTDTGVYVSHTSIHMQVTTVNESDDYFIHPLTQFEAAFSGGAVACVETSPITNVLTGAPSVVDGFTVAVGSRVLVSNQTNAAQNGIYVVQTVGTGSNGVWQRATDLSNAAQLLAGGSVTVTNGIVWASSAWNIIAASAPVSFGTTAVVVTCQWYQIVGAQSGSFIGVAEHPTRDAYYAAFTQGIAEATELWDATAGPQATGSFVSFASRIIPWTTATQGNPRGGLYFLPASSPTVDPSLLVASSHGQWTSLNYATTGLTALDYWRRPTTVFGALSTPSVFSESGGVAAGAQSGWSYDWRTQNFTAGSSQEPWTNLIIERDFQNYYTEPWNPSGADVVVYLNGQPTTIAYTLNPATGNISFLQSLAPDTVVQITIVRDGAYISNVGTTPHGELISAFVVGTTPLTTLSADFAVGAATITVTDPTQIPVNATMLELQNATTSERIYVTVNPATLAITLTAPRSGNTLFSASFTNVYLVTETRLYGIEDIISQSQTGGETYHFSSVSGANKLQTAIELNNTFSNFLTNYSSPVPTGYESTSDRGLKNALLLNFSNGSGFDASNSSSASYTGVEPSATDVPAQPSTIFAVYPASPATNGSNIRVGTDQGIWSYQSGQWVKESDLGLAARVYFIQSEGADLIAGTENGLWRAAGAGRVWTADPTYPQAVYCELDGPWGNTTFEAWGKDDGIAFIQEASGTNPFVSDHYDPIDSVRVYGLWYGQFYRTGSDGSQTKVDCVYTCTEEGLFGLTAGSRGGTYSSLLTGREMFGANLPTVTVTLPNDAGASTVPIKFYGVFQSPPTPPSTTATVPLLIMTSNGMIKVRNWRWCDPAAAVSTGSGSGDDSGDGSGDSTDTSGLNFAIESYLMTGLSCNCDATTTGTTVQGNQVAKCFVGTDKGVYRSFDEGTTWSRCERMGDNDLAVYSLSIIGSCLLAGTEDGLWVSADDGDNWVRPGAGNSCATFAPSVSDDTSFNGGYLAQTFTMPASAVGDITKVSVYLEVDVPESATDIQSSNSLNSATGNTLTVGIYHTDATTGLPITLIANASMTISAATVSAGGRGFYPVSLSTSLGAVTPVLALVVHETVATGGVSVFVWGRSTLLTPVSVGGSPAIGGTTPTWSFDTANTNARYFRVYYAPNPTAIAVTNPANFAAGNSQGVLINDAGALVSDIKLASAIIYDDSASMAWADPNTTRGTHTAELITGLWNRSVRRVNSAAYYPSFADIWTFGQALTERTTGYQNDLTTLTTLVQALYERGDASDLASTLEIAISGVTPQSIVDGLILSNNEALTQTQMGQVVAYLNQIEALGLADIKTWYATQPLPSNWNSGNYNDATLIATISQYADVRGYVAQRWAASFIPTAFVLADGDAFPAGDFATIGQSTDGQWNDGPISIFAYGIGPSSRETDLHTLTTQSRGGGKYVQIVADPSDWSDTLTSFLHGGANNLFVGTWSNIFDFEDATWIRQVYAEFTTASGGTCVAQYRVSRDRVSFAPWVTLASGVASIINDLILVLEYQVTMSDGWNGTTTVPTTLSVLEHVTIIPSQRIYVTDTQSIDGMMFEYLVSASQDIPATAQVQWGVARGDTTDWSLYEPIRIARKGALPNRQQSLQFTAQIVRANLKTTTTDNQTFQVYEDSGAIARWTTADVVQVTAQGTVVYPNAAAYALDGSRGLVYFASVQPSGLVVTVTITTPAQLYTSEGEPTTTLDGRTYFLKNGSFPADSTVIVLVNQGIVRGGFTVSSSDGTVTFAQERELTDLVTVFVQPSGVFRVGVQVLSYDDDNAVTLDNFAMEYTVRQNTNLLYLYENTPVPSVTNVAISPTGATIYDRISVDYDFVQVDGNAEKDTQVAWYRSRDGGNTFVTLDGTDSTPDYANRVTVPLADLGPSGTFHQGDHVYVIVTASDGIGVGLPVTSPSVTLLGTHIPYVDTLAILGATETPLGSSVFTAMAGTELIASYVYHNLDDGPDESVVRWYLEDSSTGVVTANSLAAGYTKKGQSWSFTVTPFDGQTYGTAQDSVYVTIT